MSNNYRFDRHRSPRPQSPRNRRLGENRIPKKKPMISHSHPPSELKKNQNLSRFLAQFRARPDRGRLYLVWLILFLSGIGLAINLFRLQILQGKLLTQQAEEQQLSRSRPFVPRRSIVDRTGNILALDRPVYTLYAHPKYFTKNENFIANNLIPLLVNTSIKEKTPAELVALFQTKKTGIKVAELLPEEVADKIKNLLIDGLDLFPMQQRLYPQEDLASEVVGYVDSERKGQAGVEYSQQNLLERTMPELRYRRAMNGAWIPDQLATGFVQFDDLQMQLTIDTRLQRLARESVRQQMEKFKAKRGALIVMDAENGELLALVSEPNYDPNQYYKFPQERFKNWPLTDPYEPGSTFKAINIAIALEAGVIKPDSLFNDQGRIIIEGWPIGNADYSSVGARGMISVSDILKYSSNVGMVRIVQQLKPQDYYQALQKLGLGQTTGSDLPFEVPSQLKKREQFLGSRVEIATTAFGQGFSITPIQLVQLNAALANGGNLVIPHVLRGLFNSKGEPYWTPHKSPPKKVFSSETTRKVLTMMEDVVQDGTGKNAQIPGYRIAGKTGTAQKAKRGGYSKSIITSFVGIIPMERPRYVVLAIFDEPQGGSGALVAAPVVKSVMESLISLEKIAPSQPQSLLNN